MGYKLNLENMNLALNELKKTYKMYAPKVFEGAGTFSDTDRVRYGEISTIEEIEFDQKSSYSYKETILPTRQTLFFFTDDECKEAEVDERPSLIFLRSCEIHSLKRIDDIYLRNGFEYSKILDLAYIAFPEISKEEINNTFDTFVKRFTTQQFKRNCLPDGPKVGSVSLSPRGDLRMPSDACVREWLDQLD